MRLVVTDACIFIDVIELQLTRKFFGLEFEVPTTIDVINELYPNQQEILRAFERAGKLTIHILSAEEQMEIAKQNFSRSLSPEDASVIFTALRLNATILSSDKPVRTFSKKLAIEYHGMLWIFVISFLVLSCCQLKKRYLNLIYW
jgi:predicted nucleic acid-binding protein